LRGEVVREICPPHAFKGLPHKLYRNKGDGSFSDVSKETGLRQATDHDNKGLSVMIVDLDGDGRPDIYVANATTENLLYLNRSSPGKLRFEDVGPDRGVARDEQGRANGTMGIAAADYDGSGRPSLVVTNFAGEWHCLYHNDGSGQFRLLSQ